MLDIAGCLEVAEADAERWLVTLRSCDLLLGDLQMGLQDRITLCLSLRDERFQQLQGHKRLQLSLGQQFRAERDTLEALFGLAGNDFPLADGVPEALRRRSERSGTLVARLRQLATDGKLNVTWQGLARRLLARHLNRLVPSAQMAHDLKFYDTLHRLYSSLWARARH